MSGSVRHLIRRLAGGRTARISRSAATVTHHLGARPSLRPNQPRRGRHPQRRRRRHLHRPHLHRPPAVRPAGPGRLLTQQPGHGQRGAGCTGYGARSSPTTASWSASTHASAGQPDGRHPDRDRVAATTAGSPILRLTRCSRRRRPSWTRHGRRHWPTRSTVSLGGPVDHPAIPTTNVHRLA